MGPEPSSPAVGPVADPSGGADPSDGIDPSSGDGRRAGGGGRRGLGWGDVFWGAITGAAGGFAAAALVDLRVDAEWQGAWTGDFLLGGAVALPLLLFWLVRSGRAARGVGWRTVRLLWDLVPILAALGAAYAAD